MIINRYKIAKVILQGYIDIPEVSLASVISELPNHILLTQKEPGCLSFKVVQDVKDSLRFNVYEEFESEAAFESHQERVSRSDWSRITKNASRKYRITRV